MTDPARVAAAVTRNVGAQRARRGLTLEQLAARSGVSKAMLVHIEQGRTNPSVATLVRIADALGVTIARLVETQPAPDVRVVAPRDATELWRTRRGGVGRLLVGLDGPQLIEFWEWRMAPRDRYIGQPHPTGTTEVLFVLEGELSVGADQHEYRASVGQTVVLSTDRPHWYANNSTSLLRFTMTVIEPGSPDPPVTATRSP